MSEEITERDLWVRDWKGPGHPLYNPSAMRSGFASVGHINPIYSLKWDLNRWLNCKNEYYDVDTKTYIQEYDIWPEDSEGFALEVMDIRELCDSCEHSDDPTGYCSAHKESNLETFFDPAYPSFDGEFMRKLLTERSYWKPTPDTKGLTIKWPDGRQLTTIKSKPNESAFESLIVEGLDFSLSSGIGTVTSLATLQKLSSMSLA